MPLNLETREGVLRFCERQRDEMEKVWHRKGRFESNGYSFEGYVFATHDVETDRHAKTVDDATRTGEPYGEVRAMRCRLPPLARLMFPGESNSEQFGYFMRLFATAARAIGTLVMAEAWLLDLPEGVNREDLPRSLEDAPGRIEALYMIVEHPATGRVLWHCRISRDPRRLHSWVQRAPEDGEGRLVDIAPGWQGAVP